MEKVERETHGNWDMTDQILKQTEENKRGIYLNKKREIETVIEFDKSLLGKIIKEK